jgi:sialate O-acetylesterase
LGWSSPGEKITVQLDKQSKRVTAGKDGKWKLSLDPMPAGGPFQMTVKGKNTVVFNNVMLGEVWICSGQSNMEWNVRNSKDADIEIASANYPDIRHIRIPSTIAADPQQDIGEAPWRTCSPETVAGFTAVGYFFARDLMKEINVPIGLINTSWGGTHVETWISKEAFQQSEEFRSMIASMGKINLDSARMKNEEAIVKRIEGLQGPLASAAQGAQRWKEFDHDDSSWPKMKVPGYWERQGPGNIDGVIWLRRHFTLGRDHAGKEAQLSLGSIDDADETFVNGVRVGGLTDYRTKRSYTIPPGVLKEGNNVIAVRINDRAGDGGFSGEPGDFRISIGSQDQSLAGDWLYQVESLLKTNANVSPNQFPTLLYNAMIHPLIPYTIRGALWYQGESNARRAWQYRTSFPLMINDWRKRWGQGDFPFYFVQLATYNYANGNSNEGSAWAELREAQSLTLSLPNTGMVVTTDIGDPADIHPRNKQEVGKRLAAAALHDVFKKGVVASGPLYKSMTSEGNKAILTFMDTGSGLMVKDKYGYLKGFEIAGSDKKFYYAQAYVEGDKVVVHHPSVANPVAVRYGWADDASDCNLFNKEGFPASPFRTDDWKGITEEKKFNVGLIFQ